MTTGSVAYDSPYDPDSKCPPSPGLSCYLTVQNAKAAIDFYKAHFGATLVHCFYEPGTTKVVHAILNLGGSTIYLSDDFPDWTNGSLAPKNAGASPVTLVLGVQNADAVFDKALKAGAKELAPVSDQLWGERGGILLDPFGQQWFVQTHKQEFTFAEMARNGEAEVRR